MANSIHYNQLNEYMNCEMSSTNPRVGMVATMFVGSDRYPMVVTKVYTPKKISVCHMIDEDWKKYEKYETSSDANEEIIIDTSKYMEKNITYTYRKNHRWMPAGSGMWETCSIHLGKADYYMDPSF